MPIYIRKRSFFEIILPLAIVINVCIATRFVAAIGAAELRWVLLIFLLLYLFLNKKLLVFTRRFDIAILLVYLTWCVSTTLWSEIPILSFSKSAIFCCNIIIMFSAGGLWVMKYGSQRSLDWLFLVLIVALLSGFLGGASEGSMDNFGKFSLYSGLSDNPNTFGFLMAIASPLIFLKLYLNKKNKLHFLFWSAILIIDIHFLIASYSRSCIVIFMSILGFFVLSLPLSKKILMIILSFFCILIMVIMTPLSYLESTITQHVFKSNGSIADPNAPLVLQSRALVWQKSYEQAEKGGIMGGGFDVTIGDTAFSDKELSGIGYGREKSNSQFAIMEETGIIGLFLYVIILISFFSYVLPFYFRLRGADKVVMGLALGAITGLLLESIVEAWWDSSAGQELICFWTFVGVVHGIIYLRKRKLRSEYVSTPITHTSPVTN